MNDLFPVRYSWLFPMAPLAGAVVSGFFGARWLKGKSHWPIWIGVGFSALLSLCLLVQMVGMSHAAGEGAGGLWAINTWYHWIQVGNFDATAGAFIDPLTAMMLAVVCCVGFLITVFSKGYMHGEEGYFRFFAYLGLFIFSMTLLVMGSNFIMLYLGWEGVGLCSYLLIGYYYERPAAREAAKKAFLVNRVGDFSFGIGIMLIYLAFGTISYFGSGVGTGTGVLEMAAGGGLNGFQEQAMRWIPFLLMIGAFGKSAQFPLYVWLPDAMEGPTPVSALIHAATMVTAGIYMIVRCSTLFVGSQPAMLTIAAVGTFTALLAASIALRQFDLKKVFAYSTISQLGFMFAGVGLLAPVAGAFHLVTHAFFKALLFLASGVVMHAMSGELDMRKMSGLRRVLPWTNRFMLIGCLALAGFPFLSGFFSKDEIVGNALSSPLMLGKVIGAGLLVAAFMTAYYSFRLYFRVFQGPLVTPDMVGVEAGDHGAASHSAIAAGDAHESGVDEGQAHGGGVAAHDGHGHHNHEPLVMVLPLFVLMIGAIAAGYLNFPKPYLSEFLGHSPSLQMGYRVAAASGADVAAGNFGQPGAEEHANVVVMTVSGLIAVLGILLASYYHLKNRAASDALVARLAPLARLLEAKFWVDEVYQAMFVEPLKMVGRGFTFVDRIIVDGLVAIIAYLPQLGGWSLKLTIQRGYLQGYAAAMLFGVAVILLVIFL